MRQVAVPRAYVVHVGLGAVSVSPAEVRDETATRLDGLEPRLARRGDDLWVSLTVTAADLWLAVLIAMAAMTDTGYAALRIEAEPVELVGG